MQSGDDGLEEERALIRAFFAPRRRERVLLLLASPAKRKKLLQRLPHLDDLDPRWIRAVPPGESSADAIERLLRAEGASETVRVLSESPELDGRTMSLQDALREVVGSCIGTLLSCVPGHLAYYEGEDPDRRCILRR